MYIYQQYIIIKKKTWQLKFYFFFIITVYRDWGYI